MGEEPEEKYVFDLSNVPCAAERREKLERARGEARRRYGEHLAAVFDMHGSREPSALADVALDGLADWRYVDIPRLPRRPARGERCSCSCHPPAARNWPPPLWIWLRVRAACHLLWIK